MIADGQGNVHPTDANSLMARAKENGRIHLNIELDVDFQYDGHLNAEEIDLQRARIAAAQERVLSELKSPERVFRPSTIRFISLSLTPADLSHLLAMPGIILISEHVEIPARPNVSKP